MLGAGAELPDGTPQRHKKLSGHTEALSRKKVPQQCSCSEVYKSVEPVMVGLSPTHHARTLSQQNTIASWDSPFRMDVECANH